MKEYSRKSEANTCQRSCCLVIKNLKEQLVLYFFPRCSEIRILLLKNTICVGQDFSFVQIKLDQNGSSTFFLTHMSTKPTQSLQISSRLLHWDKEEEKEKQRSPCSWLFSIIIQILKLFLLKKPFINLIIVQLLYLFHDKATFLEITY